MQKVYSFMWWNMCLVSFESWELILQFVSSGLTKLEETIGYCWCPIVTRWSLWLQQWSLWLHHCDVIHWDKKKLCHNGCWPLTCAFHIPCTHSPKIIDMHRGMCDNLIESVEAAPNVSKMYDTHFMIAANGICNTDSVRGTTQLS